MTARRGRRPGDTDVTRAAILDAARLVFAERGYERGTIRGIASEAGVDPALVHHHFGTKQDLFVAAHGIPFAPGAAIEGLFEDHHGESPGAALTRLYLTAFAQSGSMEALLRSAVSNAMARDMLRDFVQHEILAVIEARLDTDDAALRAALVGSHLVGLLMARRIIGLDALAAAEIDDLVAAVGPALDRYLTGDL